MYVGDDGMSNFALKINYLTEAVRLENVTGENFENLLQGEKLSFKALCDKSVK